MWERNEISRLLNVRYPIIQGPFGGGASSVALTAAVSNAGGLGSFGLQMVEPADIGTVVAHIRTATDQAFSVNLWVAGSGYLPKIDSRTSRRIQAALEPYFRKLDQDVPPIPERFMPDPDEQMSAMLDACPPAASFVYGVPPAWVLERCLSSGIRTMGTATTVDEAKALELAGVDCIIASSMEAGGHRGSFIEDAEDSLHGAISLVPQVVDAVDLPVIAAGGIGDARGMAAALVLGARGVQIGTAFLACEESNASRAHREALFSDGARRTTLSRAISGRLARNIQSGFIDTVHKCGDILPYPVQAWIVRQLQAAASLQNRDEYRSFSAGQSASLVRHRKAADLMEHLVYETPRVLERIWQACRETGKQ
jgi:nitronate monooxygenase